MAKKMSARNYVKCENSSTTVVNDVTETFQITFSSEERAVMKFLVDNKIVVSLQDYLNNAVSDYMSNLAGCLTGTRKSLPVDEDKQIKKRGRRSKSSPAFTN